MKAISTDSDKMSIVVVSHLGILCFSDTVFRHTWVEPRSLVRHYIMCTLTTINLYICDQGPKLKFR